MEKSDANIIPLSIETLYRSMTLYDELWNDKDFTHFRHTLPTVMLSDEWEAYMLMYNDAPVAWGQIQKFLNSRKAHVARLGFAVSPGHRGKGNGSLIMDYVITQCKPFSKLVATVFADNTVMLSMFLKRGFIIEGCFQCEEILDDVERHVISLAKFQGRIQ